jgi:hypothetical protein
MVAARIHRALPHVRAEQIVVAPDCGLKYLPRDVAFGKIYAMVQGAKIVRSSKAGKPAVTPGFRPIDPCRFAGYLSSAARQTRVHGTQVQYAGDFHWMMRRLSSPCHGVGLRKWSEVDDLECQLGLGLLPERLAWYAQSELHLPLAFPSALAA